MIPSAFGLQTANTGRTILGSYCQFEASNVLDDLSEPRDICPSRTSACWKPAHAKCKEIRLSQSHRLSRKPEFLPLRGSAAMHDRRARRWICILAHRSEQFLLTEQECDCWLICAWLMWVVARRS